MPASNFDIVQLLQIHIYYKDVYVHGHTYTYTLYIYIFNLNYPGKLILCSQSRHLAASHRMDKQPESHWFRAEFPHLPSIYKDIDG